MPKTTAQCKNTLFHIFLHWAELYPILIHWAELYPILKHWAELCRISIHWAELYPILIHWAELYPISIHWTLTYYITVGSQSNSSISPPESSANQNRLLRHPRALGSGWGPFLALGSSRLAIAYLNTWGPPHRPPDQLTLLLLTAEYWFILLSAGQDSIIFQN